MNPELLKQYLDVLKESNSTYFKCELFEVTLGPKPEIIKRDLSLPPQKTKEQEAEEILFYSTGR